MKQFVTPKDQPGSNNGPIAELAAVRSHEGKYP